MIGDTVKGRPPHRGTWIEIHPGIVYELVKAVVPRTGGRGLKFFACYPGGYLERRPPHRGTWIEIDPPETLWDNGVVVPRTGGRGLK